ncbi:MAG: bifunctional oligoribonuclease/PAP phosphatase NrnA, partial [Prevotellaceae bacterium]|nr:bifunctional oligoribonuclease/PAP phosphatase NrnA [Prevotellaceae bacterium]
VSHSSPDGDAIGSSLGLSHFLQSLGKQVSVIVPNRYPDFLAWMPQCKEILLYNYYTEKSNQRLAEADLIFAVDLNALSRMGAEVSKAVAKSNAPFILIDHHPQPDDFDVVISHTEITSTCELVLRFIYQMGYLEQLSREAAICLYVGMMTDTGNFSFNSNQPEIYLIIAQLLRFGVDKDDIYNKVFNNHSADRMRLMGYVLDKKMRLYPELRGAMISLSKEELKRYNSKKGDTEGFVNLLLSIKGISIAAFFREENDRIKVSLRSRGSFPVNKLCAENYNGGGHFNAAGGESFVTLKELEDDFERVLTDFNEKYVRKYKPQKESQS